MIKALKSSIAAIALPLLIGAAFAIGAHAHVIVSADSIIIDTVYSSSIIDAHGVAVAMAPFACGIDNSGAWCDVAHSMTSNS